MNLVQRVESLIELGKRIVSNEKETESAIERAYLQNPWFIPEFCRLSLQNIANNFLSSQALEVLLNRYSRLANEPTGKTVGVVMAGNIPAVGFHDLLCVYLAGHRARIKTSSRDEVLISYLANALMSIDRRAANLIEFADQLAGADAYIATGSNNSGRYFDYYFGRYPSIIRRNRTSVAILTGEETAAQLDALANDMMLYFGLGCRNVSKLFVPLQYDFTALLKALDKYNWMSDIHRYKNNYDYHLTILLLNQIPYQTNGHVLLVENESVFSPISQVHYTQCHPAEAEGLMHSLSHSLQCVVSMNHTAFGMAQQPQVDDFADGVDTLAFLSGLNH